ncbi:uncharacterized protein A4U43_UnF7390 [Asparagus officinalis]|uniref:Uncharacterized protein n=1 Tax=Asparagus officinalis TaxID=4686 RepID=A0A1R3L678_ASPOF|nr:uncharacterized protein A4U43_UnF7390 [Asparagus officinalis]
MQEKMVDGLKTLNNKKSVEISKLKEDLDHLEHELLERNDKIKYLSEEVSKPRIKKGKGVEAEIQWTPLSSTIAAPLSSTLARGSS